jgi:hypothetical protein
MTNGIGGLIIFLILDILMKFLNSMTHSQLLERLECESK